MKSKEKKPLVRRVELMKLSWETWGYINIRIGERFRNRLPNKFNKTE